MPWRIQFPASKDATVICEYCASPGGTFIHVLPVPKNQFVKDLVLEEFCSSNLQEQTICQNANANRIKGLNAKVLCTLSSWLIPYKSRPTTNGILSDDFRERAHR